MTTGCSSGLQSRNRKRSLTTAFSQGIDLGEFEPPSKKARVRINKQVSNKQTISDEKNDINNTSDTTFIVGINKNKKPFYVRGELFCNQSKPLKNLIEANKNRVICMEDISIKTFEFIKDYIYENKHPLLTFTNIVPVLYFAQKYDIFLLIANCKQKLIQINGNVTNWYNIMSAFQKYEKSASFFQKYQSFFIENNAFKNVSNITSNNRFYDLSIASMINFIKYTKFIREEKKLMIIYKYLHKNNPFNIHSMIAKYFMKLIDFQKLSKRNPDTLTNNELLNCFIDNQQQQQHAQAISRKHNTHNTHMHTIKKEKKEFKMVVENDNDKQLKVLLNQHGFTQCIKIHTTGQGGVWRAVSSMHKNVVIKAALQIYCNKNKNNHNLHENIMNEVSILRELRELSLKDGIINLLSVIESDKYYTMVLEDGGQDLLVFTRHCHEQIVNKNMLLSDWQKSLKLITKRLVNIIYCLHEHNYVHLDLSLENILISNVSWLYVSHRDNYKEYMILSSDFKIRLIDFGAAQKCNQCNGVQEEVFKSDLRIGKPAYCAPNIFKKCLFNGKAADVWSLGVILFTLIIGCNPWRIPSENDELFQWIVLDKNMEKILIRWRREQYLSVSMKKLLEQIFVIDEKDRLTMKEIKHFDLK